MQDTDRIGQRIEALRKLRHLTQRGLSHTAGVSYSLYTKVVAGHVPATPVFLGAIARALRVDMWELTGRPFQDLGPTDVARDLRAVRRRLLAFDLPSEPEAPPRSFDELSGDVVRASALRRDCRFGRLAAMLPPLLDELSYLAGVCPSSQRSRVARLLADAYYAAECLGSGLGDPTVYLLSVDRVGWAAAQSDDALLVGAARWGRAGPLMHEGAYDTGLALLDAARAEVPDDSAAARSVLGSLHLRSGLLAARAATAATSALAKDAGTRNAWAHLDEARALAGSIGGDGNAYELSFGPTNALVTSVTVAVELGDGTRAIELAESAPPLTMPAERHGHFFIDLGRAWELHGDHDRALRALLQARGVAPEQTRYHPMVREMVLTIAAAGRGATKRAEELGRFASWLGIGV
jgi:transcriptional regulator with XRE-family HTH domain